MKENILHRITVLQLLLFALFVFISIILIVNFNNISSEKEFSDFLIDNKFISKPSITGTETYSFNGKTCTIENKNNRTGNSETRTCTYEVKTSKYNNKENEVFYYVKITTSYTSA